MTLRKQGYQKRTHILYYHCSHFNGHYIRLDLLKEQVINGFNNLKSFIKTVLNDYVIKIINKINKEKESKRYDVDTKEYDLAKARKDELDNLISKLLDSYIKGIMPNEAYENMMKKYKAEYDELSEKIKRLEVKLSNNSSNCERISAKQLNYILNIDEKELFNNDLLKSIIKSIRISDIKEEDKIIRNTHIEYYGIGELKDFYEQDSNIYKN